MYATQTTHSTSDINSLPADNFGPIASNDTGGIAGGMFGSNF